VDIAHIRLTVEIRHDMTIAADSVPVILALV
jgi:hypothetical protein